MDNGEHIKGPLIDYSILSDMPEFNSEPEPESEPEPRQDSINTLIELGYGVDDAREIALNRGISDYKDSSLSDKIKENFAFLRELGYSQDDALKMTKSFPQIIAYSIGNMNQKITDIQALSYSQNDVLKMIK
jgi:Holliday junction resolvasome RuvABC DNA-binding subunit